jgi:hypothetical protein
MQTVSVAELVRRVEKLGFQVEIGAHKTKV